jgi:hypothetical protein
MTGQKKTAGARLQTDSDGNPRDRFDDRGVTAV